MTVGIAARPELHAYGQAGSLNHQGNTIVKTFASIVGIGMALGLVGSVAAQELHTAADVETILNAARGYGSATLTEQSNGDPQITGKMDGITYQVYFQNCTNNENCEDINFYLGFLDIKPSLDKINEWNASMRFSRAYLDQDEDACVEMDLDLVNGVTAEYLDSTFGLWGLVMSQFAEHVGYGAEQPAEPAGTGRPSKK